MGKGGEGEGGGIEEVSEGGMGGGLSVRAGGGRKVEGSEREGMEE